MHLSLPTLFHISLVLLLAVLGVDAVPRNGFSVSAFGLTAVKLNNVLRKDESSENTFRVQSSTGLAEKPHKFKEHWFEQPLDHFHKTGHTFKQRYWFSDRHYKPGGPVIVLDGGETSGEDRLPFLDTGIVNILANATGGLGVVLEHRYYGKSVPVSNFSTDSLRWLNNAQALEDSARFMSTIKFPGIKADLTAPNTRWIYYGGSYAGARAAHMKILYPDIVFGAIASSGVTHAVNDFPEYNEVIRLAAPDDCGTSMARVIKTVDYALTQRVLRYPIKKLFGLQDLEKDVEFVAVLQAPLAYYQNQVWDPEVGDPTFPEFCEYLKKPPLSLLGFGGLTGSNGPAVDHALLNYAQWIRENVVSKCPKDKTVPECFSPSWDDWDTDSVEATWRAWFFQVCTEWGYFISAPHDDEQPRIVSRLLTTEYLHSSCPMAFPPGKHFAIPEWPNVAVVNALGDFAIEADRLAIIDGAVDPWRPATPHSDVAPPRKDTLDRPFKLIPDAVHHYDEYGLPKLEDEPKDVQQIHEEMIEFVKHWLKKDDQ